MRVTFELTDREWRELFDVPLEQRDAFLRIAVRNLLDARRANPRNEVMRSWLHEQWRLYNICLVKEVGLPQPDDKLQPWEDELSRTIPAVPVELR